jgi:hypothetical protein
MTVTWQCRCGESFPNGREAFLHRDRDGSHQHHVEPLVIRELTGIEKHYVIDIGEHSGIGYADQGANRKHYRR